MLKRLKVSQKLFLMVFLISVGPLIILSLLSYFISRSTVQTEVFDQNTVFFELARSKLKLYFSERKADAQVLASALSTILSTPTNEGTENTLQTKRMEIDKILKTATKEYGYSDIFVLDVDGNVIYDAVNKEREGKNRADRDYFKNAIAGKTSWTDLFYSEAAKSNIMVLSTPIYDVGGNEIVGILCLEVSGTILDNIVHAGLDLLGKTADSLIIAADGTLYTTTRFGESASQSAVLKKKITTRAQQILQEKIISGDTEFIGREFYKDYRGVPVVGTFGVVQFGDKLAGLIVKQDQAEAFDNVIHLRSILIILSFTVITIGIVIGVIFARAIRKPLTYITDVTLKISEGDLTLNVDRYLDYKDEVGSLINSIAKMVSGLRGLVTSISISARELSKSAEDLSGASEEMNASVEEMSTRVEEVDRATQNASASVEEVTSGVEEVSASAQTVAKASQELSEKARKVEISAKEGWNAVKIISEIIMRTREKSANTQLVVNQLSEKARNIGEIVQTINSIAEQTNLLALNAAIEAARAGEAGRGFAVVADEIRKLAEESKQATSRIESMLKEIQIGAESASNATSETAKVVEEAFEQSNTVIKQLETILTQVEEITGHVENLAASAQEQSAAAQEMSSAMDTVSRTITGIAEQISNLSIGFREISRAAQTVTNSAEELSNISKKLVELIERFKV